MFATLPDFTPRDSHSLWYTSSRAPILGGLPDGPSALDTAHNHHHQHHGPGAPHQRQQRGHLLQRTALARLAADEASLQRRRLHVQNHGSTWLKPPGLPKTLHQMREERREQEEHHEAMRREQAQQELAEAEAAAAAEAEDVMDDVQLDGAQDLDDEIPDADDDFALGGNGSTSEEEDEDEDEDEDEEDVSAAEEALREERRNDLVAARMRMTDDAFREALVRGDPDPDDDDMYGGGGGAEEQDARGRGHLLDEEDFAASSSPSSLLENDDVDLGMDANLDDDIPDEDAYEAGYEHTDSDAALSSDDERSEEEEEEEEEAGFVPRSATPLRAPQSPTSALRGSRGGGHRPRRDTPARRGGGGLRSSMDLSAFLSQDESSFMDSSPAAAAPARRNNMRG
ncbi:Anaphase-promoting complex, subunit 15/MND2 [Cordyceps fumosorosea ARSEF 2679]|uniref:Anaphase-promoting complex, subunit 15/MND2 n=1 Tax=Cordyceps fumosorosea (strain ARSEF 2679) TaxID=1081104 RepID=A0A167KS87_CORFA|nr:Anaphase-promoting complex, subunit 15/MND2 [Cordyceps fumosorosea ARSEF 2679]OAA52119.1 Anaphase-promoting complex, subunit 15/MND2 [Cordyceps fumosorosea ARSEF 2679]